MLSQINIVSFALFFGAIGQFIFFGAFFSSVPALFLILYSLIPWFIIFIISFTHSSLVSKSRFKQCLLIAMFLYVGNCFFVEHLAINNILVSTTASNIARTMMYSAMLSYIEFLRAYRLFAGS